LLRCESATFVKFTDSGAVRSDPRVDQCFAKQKGRVVLFQTAYF